MKPNRPILTLAERRSPTRPDSISAFGNAPDREIGAPAFSLVEILVVIALLSFIVFGLLAMFTQTQRAFRTGLTQSDVLESGRLVTDMIVREIEQTAPANQTGMNFYASMPYNNAIRPFLQALPGNPAPLRRTNLLHDIFFVAQRNQDLVGIGYFVRVNNPTNGALNLSRFGAGTLYRFEMQTNAMIYSSYPRRMDLVDHMRDQFNQAKLSEFRATKVADGVVHFLVRAFDTNGLRILENRFPEGSYPIAAYTDEFDSNPNLIAGEIEVYEFSSNAVPATVELELGILEDRAWQQFRAQPTFTAQSNFLFNAAGRVHVFRQRIPIRNVDPVAYQ